MSDQSPHANDNAPTCHHLNIIINDLGNGITIKSCLDCGCKDFAEPAAPMVADPAGVHQVELVAADRTWMDIDFADVSTWKQKGFNVRTFAATVKAVPSEALTGAARDVLAERRRQVEAEGWSHARDACS